MSNMTELINYAQWRENVKKILLNKAGHLLINLDFCFLLMSFFFLVASEYFPRPTVPNVLDTRTTLK